jgi:ComF family protein
MKFRWPTPVAGWCRVGLNLLFPARCVRCDADMESLTHGVPLCEGCCSTLGPEAWQYCSRCGAEWNATNGQCGSCREEQGRRRWYDQVVPLGAYRDELRETVLRMKRRSGDGLSAAVAGLYLERRAETLASLEPDVAVAVPMYWRRRLARGTNSAEILARYLAQGLGVTLAPGMLVRCRNTLPQADLSPSRRFLNVRGAFRLRPGYDIRGARVVLVDDILTTGATCNEISGLLKRAGVATIVAAVIARAEGPNTT